MNTLLQILRLRAGSGLRSSNWALVVLGVLLAFGPQARAQQGKNNAGTILAAGTTLNTYTTLTADAAAGASTITVASSTMQGGTVLYPFATGTGTALAAGDLVMLIQMQGATINTGATSAYGDVTAYNNAGKYELLEVRSVPSGTSIQFYCGLSNSYTASGKTQVVRIPRFTSLTLNANASIVAPAWNGTTGGIVALDVQGNLTLGTNAKIDVSGLGFRGGASQTTTSFPSAGNIYVSLANTQGAQKGESIAGSATDYDVLAGRYGRGAPANGGGGGGTHNAGGGGGANIPPAGVAVSAWTGTGNPAAGYNAAWNLESASFATSTSPGGGRGGYDYSTINQDAGVVGPGNAAWGGDSRQNYGGLGGRPLDLTGGRIFFGGGGGAGEANNSNNSAGANGGGIIYVLAGGNVTNAGNAGTSIRADGASVTTTAADDGAGGGGGGGTVVLNTNGSLLGTFVTTNGGAGGNQSGSNNDAEGPGGGGGAGAIIFNPTGFTGTVNALAGANGTSTGTALTEFPPNGATAGANGNGIVIAYATQCALVADVTTTLTGPTSVLAGAATGNFTATFTNNGPDIASTLIRTITLPTGSTLTTAQLNTITTAGGTYNAGTFTIDFGTQTNVASAGTSSFTFSFTAPTTPGATSVASVTNTNAQGTNQGNVGAPNTATSALTVNPSLSGYVYEDANYGGGSGRSRATLGAGAVGRPGAIVELYNAGGTYITNTVTDANGQYFLPFTASTNYTVRVLNASVISNRTGATFTGNATTGYTSTQVGVQTYNGTTDRVGGEAPNKVDAAAGTTGTTLASLNTGTTIAESQVALTTTASGSTTGPDFGFNFDVVTNTLDAGQGSVRQFILNSNVLGGEGSLTQTGLTAGRETSIFMIPNGATTGVPAGLRSGLTNGLNGTGGNAGAAVITLASALPAISGPNTSLDATTQTSNIGDSNTGNANAGGTAGIAGVNATTVNPVPKAEVAFNENGQAYTITVSGNAAALKGFAVYNSGEGNSTRGAIAVTNAVAGAANRAVLSQLLLGTLADGSDPGAGLRNTGNGVGSLGSISLTNSYLAYNGQGIDVGATNALTTFAVGETSISGNDFYRNGGGLGAVGDQLSINGTSNVSITGNLIRDSQSGTGTGAGVGAGIELWFGTTTTTISGNSITGSSQAGVAIGQSVGNTVSQNVISGAVGTAGANSGVGIQSGLGNAGNTNAGVVPVNTFSQNSIFNNAKLGIDLTNSTGFGAGDGVSLNDGATNTAQVNNGLDFPVLTSATVSGSNLIVQGYSRPGVVIEFFNPGTPDGTGFGEGQTYLGTYTEGSGADTNAGTGSYSGTINGLSQGSDAAANRFTFVIPLTGNFASYAAGLRLTSTATLSNATSEFSGNVLVNAAPVPNTLTNTSTIANTAGATALNAGLSGTANGTLASGTANSVAYYTVTGLPASGTLTYNGTVLTAGNIATTQITNPALLTYTPTTASTTNAVSFTYTATDANGITSTTNNNGGTITNGPATYTIPISPADVTTTLTGPANLNAGQPSGTYTATFTNNGPSTATSVTRTVALPNGATLTAAQQNTITTAYAGTTFSTTGGVTTITFPTAASVASGGSSSFSFAFTAPGTTGATSLTSSVTTATGQGANTAADNAVFNVQVNAAAPAACTPSYFDNTNTYSGLSADYYQGDYNNTLTYFNTTTRTSDSGINPAINFSRFGNANAGTFPITSATLVGPGGGLFSARYRGSVTITTAGNYTFTSNIDDHLQVWIDGNAIPATGAPQTTAFTPTIGNAIINVPNYVNGLGTSAAIPLSAGPHNILIFFGTAGGQDNITLSYSGPDTGNSAVLVPNSVLCAGPSNVPPTALAVTNPAIPGNSGPTTISSLNGSDFETTGSVTNYAIATLPANGTLRLSNGTAVTAGQVITAAQAAALTFQPAANFVGSTSFTFSAIDNTGQYSNTPATFTIPVNAADVVTTITGPATLTGNVATANNAFTATFSNGGPAAAANVTRIITLPPGATMTAAQVTASGGTYTAPASNTTSGTLDFGNVSSLASGGSSSFSFGFVPFNGGSSPVSTTSNITTTTAENGATANNTATQSSTVKYSPIPAYVTNASISSTAGQTTISALSATDQDGTVASYTIATIPTNSQGVLYYNNAANGTSGTYVAVTGPLTLTPAQAGTLRFDPNGSVFGNVTFTYTATDNEGNPSTTASSGGTQVQGPAVFTIPLSNGGISANNDSNTVPLNTATNGNVLLNDYNPDNTGLAVALSGAATAGGTTTTYSGGTATTAHGTVTVTATGGYTYTPNAGYIGSDVFAYQVCNSSGTGCTTALVNVRVYDPGTACTSGTGPNLLLNPDFNQGNTGFVTDYNFVTKPSPLVINVNGLYPTFNYAVDTNANDYHLAFQATGRSSATNPSDQFMMLNGAPSVARIYSQTVTVQPNRYYTFSAYLNNLLVPGANKGVPEIGFVINGESTSGTRLIGETPDRWVQASDVWYSGSNTSATFEIRNLSTAASGNDFGIDDVYFGTCNLAPIANNDLRTTPLNTPTTFSATANDTDADGAVVPGTFRFSNGTTSISVTGGAFTVDGSGNVTFTPTTGFTGTATTSYTVQDNATPTAGTSNPGTISITVGPPPVDLLTTSITASANPVNAGATETLTITAGNNGPVGVATNVVQTVQLPTGLTNVSFGTPTLGTGATLGAGTPSYDPTTGLATFQTIASQATGATGNVTYTITFDAPVAGPFTATAVVRSNDNPDTTPTNNSASTTVNVNPRFDLVTTLNGPTSAVQGDLITYTVTSANNGPSISPNVQQTVTGLPTGLTQVFVSNGGTYNSSTGTVTFPTIAGFATGQPVNNTISFVAPTSGTTFTPVAQLAPSTGGETAPANNTAGLNGVTNATTSTTAPTTDQANLRVSVLTASASSVAPGTSVSVNVTFVNDGPKPATGVLYQLSLAPGLTVTGLPSGATYNPTTGVVTFNATGVTVASAGSQSYSFAFTAPQAGTVMLAASVSSSTSDPVPADNIRSTTVNVLPLADVSTTIKGPVTVLAGQAAAYAVTTKNNGAGTAQNLSQTVELPANLPATTLQLNGATGTLSAGIVTFTGGATYNVATGLLTLPTIASAAAGSSTVNNITFIAPAGPASYTATASVSSTTPDGSLANNTSAQTTAVTPAVDVRTLVSGPASVPVFSPVTYSMTTINDGPSVAATIVPTLQVAANLPNLVLPSGASYNAATGLVTFATISNLSSGAAVTNSISFTMPDVAQVPALGSSTVSGGATDRNLDNNRVSVSTASATPTDFIADLSATVTSSPGTVAAGSPVTFTLTVNNGPTSTSDAASNVRPVLALPAGLDVTTIQVAGQTGTYNSSTGLVTFPGGATYNVNTGQVIFPVVSTLVANDAGGYAPLTYTVTVTAPGIDPLVATASVSSATSDPTPGNNQQTLSVPVTQAADLVTSISGPATAPAAGSTVTYAVTTTNNGATPAANATTVVVLPIANGASYSVNGGAAQTYNGTGITLPVIASQQPGINGSVTNSISFTSPSGTPGSTFAVTIPNANVTTTTTESNSANNGSSTTTTRANQLPVAQSVTNALQAPEGNTAGQLGISPLAATDADGSVATYQLTGSLPASTQGVLFYNNNVDGTSGSFVALPIGQNLTQAQANTLRFDPATTYAGNVMFTYTATDNLGAVSAAALYTIPVATDVQFLYKATPVKGGNANQYANGNVLAYGIDPNGAAYNTAGLVYNPDGSTATGTVNNGIRMGKISVSDSTLLASRGIRYTSSTGLFTVVDRTLLPRAGQTIPVSVTTVDLFGGITTQTVSLVLGQNPLPVELTDFTATAVKNLDAALLWHTAQEKNNDHFEVERSLNGTDYVKIGTVKGQGSKTTPTEYSLTDAGIGPKAKGLVYYRLKQVDIDGETSYSPVRTVTFTAASALTPAISLFPNPATTGTQLDLTGLPTGSYQVSVLDATGRIVLRTTLDAGLAHALDLNTIASGTYNVLVRGQANGTVISLTKRLIKE